MKLSALSIILLITTHTFANEKVSVALESFAWEKRQLIVFTPNRNHPNYIKYNQQLKKRKLELDDRKLLTWHVISNDKVILNTQFINSFSNEEIRFEYQIKLDEFKIVLIGYDQREKLRLENVDFEFIFSKIDQMPMRIQEMQNKENGDKG